MFNLDKALYATNIADDLDESVLKEIGHKLASLVEDDDLSRQGWLSDQDEWIKLAAQVRENKDFPWERASNVKFPLVSLASLQFHARALPSLINSTLPVQAKILGQDPEGLKLARADRVRRYMSYQILDEMSEWMDEMDRMMIVLPIIGLCYKKTYYSDNLQRCRSILVLPRDLILNYHATDYVRARMSHVILMDQNELKEFQLKGVFSDVDLTHPDINVPGMRDETIGLSNPGTERDEEPVEIVESHCWWDLDEDGYKEPYIITFHRDSKKILRIVARWEEDGVEYTPKGRVAKITACDYFTPFQFFPDPNSSVYGIGFGRLLGPINESVNTITNQLIDAGTLSNLQSGFLARGVKLKGGSTRFKPGEWKIVNTTGDDLRKGVVPMPVREPSSTLHQLLVMLIDSGNRLSSVSDMMVGENPGQNQPATTSMTVLEQGLKVFTGIYKRIHRSLAAEYKKLYKLNYRYLDVEKYQQVLDEGALPPQIPEGATEEEAMQLQQQAQQNPQPIATIEDFNPIGIDITPESDPNFVSDTQKQVKAQMLLQDIQMGLPLNPAIVTQQVLQAQGQDNIKALMTMPPPPPSIEQLEFQLEVEKVKLEAQNAYFESILKVAQAEALDAKSNLEHLQGVVDAHIQTIGLENEINNPQQSGGATSGSSK